MLYAFPTYYMYGDLGISSEKYMFRTSMCGEKKGKVCVITKSRL